MDGNGRVGRLLITLYLTNKKILDKPLLYASDFFEKNKGLYFEKLSSVRDENGLVDWIKFFLDGITSTAKEASRSLNQIIDLRDKLNTKTAETFGRRAKNGQLLLKYLFEQPVISIQHVKDHLDMSAKTANELVNLCVEKKILKEITGNKRNRLFVFEVYLELLKK